MPFREFRALQFRGHNTGYGGLRDSEGRPPFRGRRTRPTSCSKWVVLDTTETARSCPRALPLCGEPRAAKVGALFKTMFLAFREAGAKDWRSSLATDKRADDAAIEAVPRAQTVERHDRLTVLRMPGPGGDTRSSASCDDVGSPVPPRWMWKEGAYRPRRSRLSPGWERRASARFCRSAGNAGHDAATVPAFPTRCHCGNDDRRGDTLHP